jgi:hypothetical protein
MKTLLPIVAMILYGCSITDTKKNIKYDSLIVQSFNKYNLGVIKSFDSCFFVNSISEEYELNSNDFIRVKNEVKISSFSNVNLNFSFCLVRESDDDCSFFGAFDYYKLSHPNSYDSAKLVYYDNLNLKDILNKFFKVESNLPSRQIRELLKSFLYQLYYEKINDLDRPIFRDEFKTSNLNAYLTIDEINLLGSLDSTRLIVFESEYYGLLVFRWEVTDKKIVVDEYIYSYNKYKFLGGADVPTGPC